MKNKVNKGINDILTRIRISKSSNKTFIKQCLDAFFSYANMNNGEAKDYIECLICHAENNTPEDAFYISPQKQEWLKEWLVSLEEPEKEATKLKCDNAFLQYIPMEEKEEILKKLHSLIDGKKGKKVARVFKAAMKAELLLRPSFKQAMQEFGYIGAESGYNKAMNETFKEEELNPIIKFLIE